MKETEMREIRRRIAAVFSTRDEGWTFVETLIVIAIILVLTSTVGFMAFRYLGSARVAAARSQIETLSLALNAYMLDNDRYPSEGQGLEALWEKPTLAPVPDDWNGPYVSKEIPEDPWGNEYVYNVPGPNGLPFEIRSLGADGIEGGEGNDADISSWQS
jgi:general secretion pathway protein G